MNAHIQAHVDTEMIQIALVAALIAVPPDAVEVQDLENDMADGHRAVVEATEPAPDAAPSEAESTIAPSVMEQCPISGVTAKADARDAARPTLRQGFTYEVGLGLGATNDYVDSDNRLVGMLSAGLGGFLNNRTALLLHFAGVSSSHSDTVRFNNQRIDRDGSVFSLFLGPQLQWFPIDRLMFAVGVGGVARLVGTRVDVRGTSNGDYDDAFAEAGVGASARAAVTVYQRPDIAAVRVGVEALPSYVQSRWHTSVGLMVEIQAF